MEKGLNILKTGMQEVLFRVNAGVNVGYGHVVRCMQIAKELADDYLISFSIYAQKRKEVESFFSEISSGIRIHSIIYIERKEDDLPTIVDYVQKNDAFLVLDHYDVDEAYQLFLKEKGIHWLQLDSYAAQKFYGDVVQHGSPGATEQLYAALHGSPKTKFLLGTKYVIVNRELRYLHENAKVRQEIKNVFVSFGGGYAKGALLKYIETVGQFFPNIEFDVVLRANNPDIESLKRIEEANDNVRLYIDFDAVYSLMCVCDIAILAAGGMSYEAATVGLPSILIAVENNQLVNLKGCSDIGISTSLSLIEKVSPQDVITAIDELRNNPHKLKAMSAIALREFDGRGVERIAKYLKDNILSKIN